MTFSVFQVSLMAQWSRICLPCGRLEFQSLGREDPLENEKATYFSTLAWRIPWTEELGRLQSMGSQRVRHNCVTNFHFHRFFRRNFGSKLRNNLNCYPLSSISNLYNRTSVIHNLVIQKYTTWTTKFKNSAHSIPLLENGSEMYFYFTRTQRAWYVFDPDTLPLAD